MRWDVKPGTQKIGVEIFGVRTELKIKKDGLTARAGNQAKFYFYLTGLYGTAIFCNKKIVFTPITLETVLLTCSTYVS
jgi:hypothetical protein